MNLDLSYSRAATVLVKEHSHLRIIVVGAGGTGSYAAPAIARLVFELMESGRSVEMMIVDPDRVARDNIPRSNFCYAEIGRFKAQTIAERLVLAWGFQISYSNEEFDKDRHLNTLNRNRRELTIIVGCVDNHRARLVLHQTLQEFNGYRASDTPELWWVDGGNGRSSGQVLIGSTTTGLKSEKHFTGSTICLSLPAPSVVHPDLLIEQAPEITLNKVTPLSCPERIRSGEQGLHINQRVAVEIAEVLTELLLSGSLRRFGTYFDLESGTSRSLYCTPEIIDTAVNRGQESFNVRKRTAR